MNTQRSKASINQINQSVHQPTSHSNEQTKEQTIIQSNKSVSPPTNQSVK